MSTDDDCMVAVSPRHSVRLAREYVHLLEKAPKHDYVVRTIVRREANGLPLMSAEIVIAGYATRKQHPLAERYPLHFRKTYSAARLHGDTSKEYEHQVAASELIGVPPPIGFDADVFRSCLVPGRPYNRLSPFGTEPEESNMRSAQTLPLAAAAGLWRLSEQAIEHLTRLHDGGLAHGDAELHNFVVCPAPLELVLIDFESSMQKKDLDESAWEKRCAMDLVPLLREAVFLQCALGRQQGKLADLSWERMSSLFRSPDRFRRAIEEQADLSQ
ncbi:MAG TPA: hypothetical protein VHC69_19100 [Polyangiaceae bacterium]|nr:hypothetical protein [Polyangiaceae bacterium]